LQHPISDDPNEQLLLQIQGAVAEYERAVLNERFRRGKLHKARTGQYLGSNPPYGYRYLPKRTDGMPGQLVVEPAEAELVQQVYRWLVDEQLTCRQIVKRLNASSWRPRSGRPYWSVCVVHAILSNPIYTGTAYANRTACLPPEALPGRVGRRYGSWTPRLRRPPEDWVPIPTPALIDPLTAERAKAQLARNAALSYRHNTQHTYLLRCLLTCGTCGRGMAGNLRHATATLPEYRYYVCYGKDCLLSHREAPCPHRSVKAAELEAAVGSISLSS
jgi:site-specific DNA recombinase